MLPESVVAPVPIWRTVPIWLLDEPLSPLDAGWRVRFGEMMSQHLASGGMIVAAVHDPLPIPAQLLEILAPEDAFQEPGE